MSDLNQCQHEWTGGVLWAVASTEHPKLAIHNPEQHVGHVPLEYCIHCGVVRLPEGYQGKGGNIAF